MEHFTCTHCGHHFETEPSETLICPHCFWSTSVKKTEEVSGAAPSPEKSALSASIPSSRSPRLLFWAGGGFLGLLLVGVSIFAVHHLEKQDKILKSIEVKNSQIIASEAPELALPPREQKILSRKISLNPERELSDSEREILNRRIPFRTRLAQGLSTPPWSEEQFEAFLKGEESHYKIPLEWSYRRKLKKLFKEHYLPAAQAFEAKDFLKARDEWIRSLAFPVYRNDAQRHRGVILTMLHPYVNDTLSKIGMMNVLLTQKDQYGKELKIQESYDALLDLAQKHSWEEANAKVLEIENDLKEIEQAPPSVSPPPLPKEIPLIDSDIREVLLAQAAPAQAGSRDWEALREDVAVKAKVLQSRIPGTLGVLQKQYEEARAFIENQNWREAKALLEKIDFPEELADDARAKIKILNRWLEKDSAAAPSQSLDSQKNSS